MAKSLLSAPIDLVRSLVSAAQPLAGSRKDNPSGTQHEWQVEGWGFYDEAGPLRYGVTWLANLISRAQIRVGKIDPNEVDPVLIEEDATGDDEKALSALDDLAGGPTGQAAMLRMFGTLILVPGVGYLIAVDEADGTRRWHVSSAAAITLKTPATPLHPAVYTRQIDVDKSEVLPADSLVVRVWQPHPNVPWSPDSATRAALSPLRELRRISQYVDATLASRVASTGLLVFPEEATFPAQSATQESGAPRDPFITEVMNVMMAAIKNPGTAASVVPIPIKVAGQYVDKVRFIDMASQLSDRIIEMRDSALRQVAIALDVPAEVLTGMGAMNHWGAWQIEEQAIKTRAEPLLDVILGGLTDGYLLPVLGASGVENPEQYVFVADTSELVTRPDKSANASEAYDRIELSGESYRRETGFEEADAPDDDEVRERILRKLLDNQTLAQAAAAELGVDLTVETTTPAPTGTPAPQPELPAADPTVDGAPAETPATPPPVAASTLAVELVVMRALEKAGNRIRSAVPKHAELNDCPPEHTHCCVGGVTDPGTLLQGAWSKVPLLAEQLGYDVHALERALDTHCRELLQRGFAYDRDALVELLLSVPRS